MLNKFRCHAHFLFSANHIVWSRLLMQLYILHDKQCRSRSVGFWRSHRIWIYTICEGGIRSLDHRISFNSADCTVLWKCLFPMYFLLLDTVFLFCCRYCLYPQDLVINLEQRSRIRKIQVLSHQTLIGVYWTLDKRITWRKKNDISKGPNAINRQQSPRSY